ncbi:MAG: hypothetical protein AAFQ87_00755 [Bacteroidota bacterium]
MNFHTARLLLLSTLLSVLSLSSLKAQDYDTAIGIRLGSANGVSLKHFVNQSTAVEGMLVYRRNGFRLIGMAVGHVPLGRNTDTYLYFGGGGHVGYNNLLNAERSHYQVAGIDGMLGIEFGLPNHNASLAFDIKPMYELMGGRGFSGNNGGVTLRFWLN